MYGLCHNALGNMSLMGTGVLAMRTAGDIANIIIAAVAVVGVVIAVIELGGARTDAKAARIAELAWNIYQEYDSSELRKGRRELNTISRTQPMPRSGEEFGAMYVTRSYQGAKHEEVSSQSIRRILRFYHHIGILLDKGLIDGDFVFPLIGDGLDSSQVGIRVTTEWHQNFYGGESGHEKAAPRRIYANAVKLIEKYEYWNKNETAAIQSNRQSLLGSVGRRRQQDRRSPR